MKIAKIRPVLKKGDHDIVYNYRPFSIIPALSKVFEKVAYIQSYDYLVENKLLYPGQYGFRKNHSTELTSIEFIDNVIHKLDKSKFPLSVFLDLSRAFDTRGHSISSHKLKYYGADGPALDWFLSYLCNRTQYVQVDDSLSSPLPVTTGVPQGSILGPIHFVCKWYLFGQQSLLSNPLRWWHHTYQHSLCLWPYYREQWWPINSHKQRIGDYQHMVRGQQTILKRDQNIIYGFPLISPKIHYRF